MAATPEELARIKNNVHRMVNLQAPESDIDLYIESEGVTIDDIRNFSGAPVPSVPGGIEGDIPSAPVPVAENRERTGDFLKPVFGGRNPVAEAYDVAAPALDPSSDRNISTRARDTAAFLASAPLQMFRLPSLGDMAQEGMGFSGLKQAETSFVENNPALLRGMGAIGEAAAYGGPMGQGFRMPPRPEPPPRLPRNEAQISEDVARARGAVEDMQALGVEPFGPAVAAAKKGDNSGGAITMALADKPVIGTPLQRRNRQFIEDLAGAQDNIRQGYGQSTTMQGAGAQLRGRLESFKNDRTVDVSALTPDQLEALAAAPPRLNTLKDVMAAKYLRAEKFLPEEKAKAQPVKEGEERIFGSLSETREVLKRIKKRYTSTINQSEAKRQNRNRGVSELENDVDYTNPPSWTGSPMVDRSMDAIVSSVGNWRTGLEGMRNVRSNIRRVLSSKGDTEVNAATRGDLKALYKAVSDDMDRALRRLEEDVRAKGDDVLADSYKNAREAYKDADRFTARYAERMEQAKKLFRADTDEQLMQQIKTATRDGSRGNLQSLVALRRVVPNEVMDEVASALIVDLGAPTGRASGATKELNFSGSMFASNWDNMNPKARKLVFGHRPGLHAALDRFSRVSQNLADFEALYNKSRTGVSNMVAAVIAAGGAGVAAVSPQAIAALAGFMLAGRSASSILASPAYVNWLTRASVLSRNGSPSAISKHARRLKKLLADSAILQPQEAQALGIAADQIEQAYKERVSSETNGRTSLMRGLMGAIQN